MKWADNFLKTLNLLKAVTQHRLPLRSDASFVVTALLEKLSAVKLGAQPYLSGTNCCQLICSNSKSLMRSHPSIRCFRVKSVLYSGSCKLASF